MFNVLNGSTFAFTKRGLLTAKPVKVLVERTVARLESGELGSLCLGVDRIIECGTWFCVRFTGNPAKLFGITCGLGLELL